MKRLSAFLAVLALSVSLMSMGAGGQVARAEEPDPTPSASASAATDDNKSDHDDSSSNQSPTAQPQLTTGPVETPASDASATQAAKDKAAAKAAAKKKAQEKAKAKAADAATPTVTVKGEPTPDDVLLRVSANGGDLTGCTITLTKAGESPDSLATNLTIVQSKEWTKRTESLLRGTYTLSAACNEDSGSDTFTVGSTEPAPKPAQPKVSVTCEQCAHLGAADGSAKVVVTNTADDTYATVAYTVSIGAVKQTVTIKDGESATLEFTGLTAGEHKVTVKGDDGTCVDAKVTVKDCPKPAPKVVKLKVQVDKYSTATSKLRSKAAGYDNDGLLKEGEDKPHYGKSTWEIVTVTGTTETTMAEWIAKINAATKKVPNLKSTRHWTVKAIKKAKAKSITQAWVISGDGKPTAWYAGHTKTGVAQRHFASNR